MSVRRNSIPRHRSLISRRLVQVVTVFALFVGVTLVCAHGTIQLARRAIAKRTPEAALSWLRYAEWFRLQRGEIEFLRARCLRHLGRSEEFRDSIKSAEKLGFNKEILEREQVLLLAQMGRLQEIEQKIPRILETAGDDSGEVCESYVSGLLMNFRQVEALSVLDAWAKDYPLDPQPVITRGRILKNSGRLFEAELAYSQALKLDPHSHEIPLRLGEVLMLSKKTDAAVATYRSLLTDEQLHDIAALKIARCERQRGDLDASQQSLNQVHSRNKLPLGDFELEQGLLELDHEQFEDAANSLTAAKISRPRSLEVCHALAQALRGCGRIKEATEQAAATATAEAELQRADLLHIDVSNQPNNYQLRLEIGRILLKYGDIETGVIWVQSVLNVIPNEPEAIRILAGYYEDRAKSSPEFSAIAMKYRALTEIRK